MFHLYIIFRVAVSRSKDVPPFGPNIPVGAKFGKQRAFADFLLTKGDGKFCMSAILDFFISSGNQCFVLNLEEIRINKNSIPKYRLCVIYHFCLTFWHYFFRIGSCTCNES